MIRLTNAGRVCLVCLLLVVAACSGSATVEETAGPSDTVQATNTAGPTPSPARSDRSNGELALAWWAWAASEPDATNPVVDPTGEDCARNQPDDVWFLAGTFGTAEARTCTVPQTELFFPVLNSLCGPLDGCEGQFAGAEMTVVLDGEPIEPIEINSAPGRVTAIERNSVTGSGGTFEAVATGFWVRLDPLEPGTHTLSFTGTTPAFGVAVQYTLNVTATTSP